MYLYDEQFSEKYDLTRVDATTKTLIIASTGRCGSHMLGHALQKTNCFGFPLEYVNPSNIDSWKTRFGKKNLEDTLTAIQYHRTSPNGVFGIKIHYSHIKSFKGFNNLKSCFKNAYFVHLTRKNVVKQAVSMFIAEQTGVWITGQKPKNITPEYSFKNINRCLKQIIKDNASWQYILEVNACNYIQMDFDIVRLNLEKSIRKIANHMNIDVDLKKIPTQQVTKKQSDILNSDWESRFLNDYRQSELFTPNYINAISRNFK